MTAPAAGGTTWRVAGAACAATFTAVFLAGGCTAMSTIKTATTVPRGQTQMVAALEGNGGAPVELPVRPLLPELVIGARRGLTDRVEAGLKLTTLPLGERLTTAGLEAQAKIQVRRRADSRIEVAVGPAAGFRWISSSGASMQVSYATLPLMVGCNLGRHQLVLSPEAGVQLWSSAGASAIWAPVAGLSLGFVWRVGQRLALVPEVAGYRSTLAIDHSSGTSMIHVGVGVLY